MRSRLPLASAVLVLAIALTGCSSGASSESADSRGGAPALAGPEAEQRVDGEFGDREVITTGQLDLIVDEPGRAADAATEIVRAAGGRVDASSRTPANEYQGAYASVTARIPADELQGAIEELSALGEVSNLSTQSTDVTMQTTDLDARIESLTAAVDRLRALLATAESTADLIAIETALSERESELESLLAQREYLADQVSYSTLSIGFTTPADAPATGPTDFWSAIVAGFSALVASLGALVIGIGAALPWLLFLALLALAILGIVRLARRSRGRRPGARADEDGPSDPPRPSGTATL